MKNAELAMVLAGTALQATLCLLLWAKGSYRQFRFFTLCTAFSVLSTLVLIPVRNNFSLYFMTYWTTEALSVVLTFVSLQESFYLVFRNFLNIPWFKILFPGIGVLMLIISVLRASLHPASQARLLTSTLISLEIGVGFLQLGIFCLFVMLVRFFNMRWRQQAFGVVLGFGVSAAGSLVVFLLRSEFGTKFDPVVRITPPIAYIIAVLVWLGTFWGAEPVRPVSLGMSSLTPEQLASDLRRYTRAVKGILER